MMMLPIAEITIDPVTVIIAILSLLGGQSLILLAITLGVRAFKNWFMSAVVNPHISPMKIDLADIKTEQKRQGVMVDRHDQDLNKYTTWTLLLLGKVFGGIPNLDIVDAIDEPHTRGEPPLVKRETPPHD